MTVAVRARNSGPGGMVVADAFLRFACPHCRKVLKVRTDVAAASGGGGGRGRCPQCRGEVEFQVMHAQLGRSWMGAAILRRMGEADVAGLWEEENRRLALLLSQGTCRDYGLAGDLLGGRKLPARQWRRVLGAAAQQELMRKRIEMLAAAGDSTVDGFSLCGEEGNEGKEVHVAAAGGNDGETAWQVMARFLYQQKHGVCAACRANPTGMACAFLDFERFCAGHDISVERARRWRSIIRRQVGL